jgi:hypothetical protein
VPDMVVRAGRDGRGEGQEEGRGVDGQDVSDRRRQEREGPQGREKIPGAFSMRVEKSGG